MPEAIDKLWKEVWKRWSKSNAIKRFPWADKKLLEEHPELEERMFNALTNENRFLVSRCLVTLEAVNSAKLAALPSEIFQREDRIQLLNGSFGHPYTVGHLAREILTRYQERNANLGELSDVERRNKNWRDLDDSRDWRHAAKTGHGISTITFCVSSFVTLAPAANNLLRTFTRRALGTLVFLCVRLFVLNFTYRGCDKSR